MPVGKYFKGHGTEVMANMQKEYGMKKGKSAFYATAKKRGMKSALPKGSSLSPKGDIGKLRGKEAVKVMKGGFKGAKIVSPSHYFKGSRETYGSQS